MTSQTPESESHADEEDYYMDGPYIVFTASFHRKRGFCCGSDCRHCPYKEGNDEAGGSDVLS